MMQNKYHTATYLLKKALKENGGLKKDRKLLKKQNIKDLLSQASEILAQKNNITIKMMIFKKVRSLMSKEQSENYTMKKFEEHLKKTHLIK